MHVTPGGPGPVLFVTTSEGYGLAQRVDSYQEVLIFAERILPAFEPGLIADLVWEVDPRSTVRADNPARSTKEDAARRRASAGEPSRAIAADFAITRQYVRALARGDWRKSS